MPAEPPRPCVHPGCARFALSGKARCTLHLNAYDAQIRANVPALRLAARIRSSSQWQQVRRNFRIANPICCDPFAEHRYGPEPTEDIHHVVGLAADPTQAHDEANLRPLCRACHNRVEQMERSGESTQHLFA